MERNILNVGYWIARNADSRADVRAAVMLVMRRQRQLLAEVNVPIYDRLDRRVRYLLPRQWFERSFLETRQHLAIFHTHSFCDPFAVRHETGNHWHWMPTGTGKQGRLIAIEPLCDRSKLEAQRHLRPDHHKAVTCGKIIEPIAQRGDWWRPVAAGSEPGRSGFAEEFVIRHGKILSWQQHR